MAVVSTETTIHNLLATVRKNKKGKLRDTEFSHAAFCLEAQRTSESPGVPNTRLSVRISFQILPIGQP